MDTDKYLLFIRVHLRLSAANQVFASLDFFEHPPGFCSRVGSARDLAAHHQIVGAVADGFERSGYSLLIAFVAAGRADARSHQDRARARDPAHRGYFEWGCDDTVHSAFDGVARTLRDQVRDVAVKTKLGCVFGSEAREDRDCQEFETNRSLTVAA